MKISSLVAKYTFITNNSVVKLGVKYILQQIQPLQHILVLILRPSLEKRDRVVNFQLQDRSKPAAVKQFQFQLFIISKYKNIH